MSRVDLAASSKRADAARVFAALGDETRLRIVVRLCREGPLPIMHLAQGAGISRQAITKHLHALQQAGLARSSRAGRERVWELRVNRLADVQLYLNQISAQWDAALDRLRNLVEQPSISRRSK